MMSDDRPPVTRGRSVAKYPLLHGLWEWDSSGSLGFPKIWVGGFRNSPPPPPGDKHIPGQATSQMGNIHICVHFLKTSIFLGYGCVYWCILGVYCCFLICVHCLMMDLAVKHFVFSTFSKKKQKVEKYTPKNTIYWPLAKTVLASVYFIGHTVHVQCKRV